MPAELAPASGRLVAGRYRLQSVIGRGGAGTVWRAEDVLLRRVVAVKEVHLPASLSDEERTILRERVLREARAAAAVRHPVLVTVFDVVEDEDRPWLVLEYIEARTLSARVADRPLTPSEAARIGLDLLAALRAVHRAGVQHRDVKPGNVLIETDGRARLTDFGIASTAGDPALTSTGILLGSPSYLPPERARGGPGGPESDLWGLAATLYTAVEGVPPYEGEHALAVLTAVVEGRRRPAVQAGRLEPLLADLLDSAPEDRPGADEVQSRLLAVVGDELGQALLDPASNPGIPAFVDEAGTAGLTAERSTATGGAARDSEAGTTALSALGGDTSALPVPEPRRDFGRPRLRRRDEGRASGDAGRGWSLGSIPPRRRRIAAAAIGLVALLLVGTVVVLLRSGSGSGPASTPSPAASAPAVTLPRAVPDATAATVTTPAGWVRYTDPTGWSIAHPAGWRQTALGQRGMDFVEPGTGSYLHVETAATAPASVLQDWQSQEGRLAPRVSNYVRVRIAPADGGTGAQAADWEFTFALAGSPLRAIDRGLTNAGTGYSLYWQTPADRWAASTPTVAGLFGSFATH